MSENELVSFSEAPFDIIDGDRGKNYPKKSEFTETGHCLFLSATNVTKAGFKFSECQFIDQARDQALNKGKLQRNDIVLTTRGTIGNTAYYNDAVTFDHLRINSGMVIFRCDSSKLLPGYLYHFVRSPDFFSQVDGLRSGAAQPQLPIRDMRRIRLPLPSLPTQRRIAGILSAYDDLIENNLRRIRILEEMAQSLYREWFVHFRFPGHESVPLVASPLGPIPDGWEVKRMPEAVEVRPKIPVPKDNEIPFIPMGSLSENSMLIGDVETRAKASGARFQNGDTVFARITPCLENGKTGFVQFLPDDDSICCGSTEFIVLRSKTVCPEYVYLMARSDPFRDNAIKSMSGATGRQRVRDECFEQFLLAQPPSGLLSRFSATTQPQFQLIHSLNCRNQTLRQTRDLLLPKLLNPS